MVMLKVIVMRKVKVKVNFLVKNNINMNMIYLLIDTFKFYIQSDVH